MVVTNDIPLLPPADNSDPALKTSADASTTLGNGNGELSDGSTTDTGLARVAIGVAVGATVGGILGALTNKSLVDRINRTVRDLGNTVKQMAANVNDNVQNVGEAVYSVSTGVNDTVEEVKDAVVDAAEGINSTVKQTFNTVKNTAEDVRDTVKSTVNTVKETTEGSNPTQDEPAAVTSDNGTLYKLIPVSPSDSIENA